MSLIHYQYLPSGSLGFVTSKAKVTVFPDAGNAGTVVRLDISQPQQEWKIGQHFYLCFTALSIWQSHPFTPMSLPSHDNSGHLKHSYIIRAKKGLTAKLPSTALTDLKGMNKGVTPVVMQGPYGENLVEHLTPDVNILAVAGGTGITYVLPVLLCLTQQSPAPGRKITLIWAVRHHNDIEWIRPELDLLLRDAVSHDVEIRVHVTREAREPSEKKAAVHESVISDPNSSSNASTSPDARSPAAGMERISGRPELSVDVEAFVRDTIRGRTEVLASGPATMISELRSVVADLNRPQAVWRGKERFDVDLRCDDRLEW